MSPHGQDCIQRPFILAWTTSSLPIGQVPLLDRTTSCLPPCQRRTFFLPIKNRAKNCPFWAGLHVARTASSVPLYRPGLHEVYLLDKFTARQDYTLSPRGQNCIQRPFIQYWPGPHEVYLVDKFTAIDRKTSCLPPCLRRTLFLPIKKN